MPVQRLHPTRPQRVDRYSVVAMYPDNGDTYVQHVAILRDTTDLCFAMENVRVWQMGPPLVAGDFSAAAAPQEGGCCSVHLVGGVELDSEEIKGIETWLAEVDKEIRPLKPLEQYVVHPPMSPRTAENGSRLYRRFSCVGFVLECYRSVEIDLVSADCELPATNIDTLARAYRPAIRRESVRRMLGVPEGDCPRVFLAGYVVHALNRSDESIRESPYVPASDAEANFP